MSDVFKSDHFQKLHESRIAPSKWPQATSISNYQKQAQQKLSRAELCFGIVLQSDKMITLKENFVGRLINISSYLTTPKQQLIIKRK